MVAVMAAEEERRECVIFWMFQGFRSRDDRLTRAELERVILDDPIVQTVIWIDDEDEVHPWYHLDFETHTATWHDEEGEK